MTIVRASATTGVMSAISAPPCTTGCWPNRPAAVLLRIDDTDAERSREDYVEAIRADLAWLGIAPDGEERQSARLARYDAAFAKLQAAGRVYPCYETQQELELKRKIRLGRGLAPIYDRGALELGDAERAAKEAECITPHWRSSSTTHPLPGIRRARDANSIPQLSDPVIRAEGSWPYGCSAVDDPEMGITYVLRRRSRQRTAVQIQMFDALIAGRAEHPALRA